MVNSQYPEIISLQVNREILYFVPTETGSVRVFRYGLITMGGW